jgi:hypothetical protein
MKDEWHTSPVFKVMISWPFLICLAALLANDWWLKYAFPGTFTGKLSDFAGIALVGFLAVAIWPKRVVLVVMTIATAFFWWKSPLSGKAIEWVNIMLPFHLGRTIDYTDIVALCVLPFCPHLVNYADKYPLIDGGVGRALRIPLATVTAFAIMGTSAMPTRDAYSVRDTSPSTLLQQDRIIETIAEVMKQHGLRCSNQTKSTERVTCSGYGMVASYAVQGADAVSFNIYAFPDGLLFGSSRRTKTDALRAALKSALAERFSGLEYIEPSKVSSERER